MRPIVLRTPVLRTPKPLWAVVCPDGRATWTDTARTRAVELARRRTSHCPYCERVDAVHRVMRYVAEELGNEQIGGER